MGCAASHSSSKQAVAQDPSLKPPSSQKSDERNEAGSQGAKSVPPQEVSESCEREAVSSVSPHIHHNEKDRMNSVTILNEPKKDSLAPHGTQSPTANAEKKAAGVRDPEITQTTTGDADITVEDFEESDELAAIPVRQPSNRPPPHNGQARNEHLQGVMVNSISGSRSSSMESGTTLGASTVGRRSLPSNSKSRGGGPLRIDTSEDTVGNGAAKLLSDGDQTDIAEHKPDGSSAFGSAHAGRGSASKVTAATTDEIGRENSSSSSKSRGGRVRSGRRLHDGATAGLMDDGTVSDSEGFNSSRKGGLKVDGEAKAGVSGAASDAQAPSSDSEDSPTGRRRTKSFSLTTQTKKSYKPKHTGAMDAMLARRSKSQNKSRLGPETNNRRLSENALAEDALLAVNEVRARPSKLLMALEERMHHIDTDNLLKLPNFDFLIQLQEGKSAVEDAMNCVLQQPSLPPLKWAGDLSLLAQESCAIAAQEAEGIAVGVQEPLGDRISAYGDWSGHAAEVFLFGERSGKQAVVDMVVNDGQPDRVQRSHVFSPTFHYVGIGVGKHPTLEHVMVLVFVDHFFAAEGHSSRRRK